MFISSPGEERGEIKYLHREKSGPVENFHGKPELYLDFGGESAKSAKSIQIKNCSGPRIPIWSSWKNVNGSQRGLFLIVKIIIFFILSAYNSLIRKSSTIKIDVEFWG